MTATIVLGATVLLAAIDFVIADPVRVEATCGDRPFACGIGTGLAVTVFAVALTFVFWTVLRKDRLVAAYLRLFPKVPVKPPRAIGASSRSVPRRDLYELITDDLRVGSPRPQLIVGGIGTGKSTALADLTEAVAHAGAVPVFVNLADAQQDLDFGSLAREVFLRHVRSSLIREDEGFGVWQRLLREGRLVVLADALGNALAGRDDRPRAIRQAVEEASTENYGLVIAARPEDVPSGLNVATFELAPLDVKDAVDFVMEHRPGGAPEREVVRAFVVASEATDTPFYLRYLCELYGAGLLSPIAVEDRSRFALRVALLEEYFGAVTSGALRRDTALLSTSRARLVEALASAALAGLRQQRSEIELTSELVRDPWRTAQDAARLELVDSHGSTVAFRFAILQGYLAATELARDDDPVEACLGLLREGGRDAAVAVGIAAGLLAGRDALQATDIARGMVAWARGREDGTRFPVATAAVDVATLLPGEGGRRVERDLLDMLEESQGAAAPHDPPIERARFARRLARLGDDLACRGLWRLSLDADYVVRLSAARRLAALGETAVRTLREDFDADIDYTEQRYGRRPCDPDADRRTPLDAGRRFPVAVQCWVLPSLHTSATQSRAWSRELLGRWVDICWHRADPGIEASLAQGLKFAATDPTQDVPFHEVLDWSARMLDQARFWYSRINLLHAVAMCGARAPECGNAARACVTRAVDDAHPLVVRTARLCVPALDGDARRWIWGDEVEVSRRADSSSASSLVALGWRALDAEASTLIADVIVALNLIEGDSRVAAERAQRLERACGTMPGCLEGGEDERGRLQVRGTAALTGSPCPESCGLRLCPYPARSEPTFRGELNEAFCREQARRHASDRVLAAFWGDMEQRARS